MLRRRLLLAVGAVVLLGVAGFVLLTWLTTLTPGVTWENSDDLRQRTLLVWFDRDRRVAHKLVLPYLMAHEPAKEIPSPLDKVRAWLGW
jgi:hypothetical protein